MAKRKNKSPRKTGLAPNELCPHCGAKVKETVKLLKPEGEYIVFHWWLQKPCYSSPAVSEYMKMRKADEINRDNR